MSKKILNILTVVLLSINAIKNIDIDGLNISDLIPSNIEDLIPSNINIPGLSILTGLTSATNVKCLWANYLNVYTLNELNLETDDYTIDTIWGNFTFSFCQNTLTKVENENNSMTTIIWKPLLGKQIRISGDIEGGIPFYDQAEVQENGYYNLWTEITEEENQDKGIIMELAEGERCNETSNHKTYFEILCDKDVEDEDFITTLNFSLFNPLECTHVIKARSIYGCSLNSFYLLERLIQDYKYIFIALCFLIGFFLCFFGTKFITPTIIVMTTGIVGYIVVALVLTFIPKLITTEKRLWLLIGGGLVLGLIVGFIIKRSIKSFVVIIGSSLGYILGSYIYQAFQPFILSKISFNPQILYYVIRLLCGTVCGIIALCIVDVAVIVGTSFLGAFLMMRGATLIFGNYSDPKKLIDLMLNQEWDQIKATQTIYDYIYLGSCALCTLIGIIVQCKYSKKKKNKDKDNDKDYKRHDK